METKYFKIAIIILIGACLYLGVTNFLMRDEVQYWHIEQGGKIQSKLSELEVTIKQIKDLLK